MTLKIDATMLRDWGACRELFRYLYVEKITSAKPAIHREFGIAFHEAVKHLWLGDPFQKALLIALEHTQKVSTGLLNPAESEKWATMLGYLPDMVAVYADSTDFEREYELLEEEFEFPYSEGVSIVGRIDRYQKDGKLIDIKTATEFGKTWKADYRKNMLRDPGLMMYDFYLRQVGKEPKGAFLEVVIKPYRDKGIRVEIFDMKEIISDSYRRRFEQQLKWAVSEIKHYLANYGAVKPWPMSSTQCQTKFGFCEMIEICCFGGGPRALSHYVPKEDHLEVRKYPKSD